MPSRCMIRRTILRTLVFLHAFSVSAQELPEKSKFHLYVLAGQSNMAGRGKISEEDRQPIERVFMLDKDGRWRPAVDPLHFDKPAAGVGLGRTFAAEMLKDLPVDVAIGLIPTAAGGSAIDSWIPGGYHDQTRSHPYDDAMKRIRVASDAGTIKGILWHQGESDCSPELSATYETKLHVLISRFRKELDSPDLPFVAGQMGQFAERPWNDDKKRVDEALKQLPKKVTNSGFVRSDGLGHLGDEIHFSSQAYKELGSRYAAEMKRVLNGRRRDSPASIRK